MVLRHRKVSIGVFEAPLYLHGRFSRRMLRFDFDGKQMEVGAPTRAIKDIQSRTDVLRGYL